MAHLAGLVYYFNPLYFLMSSLAFMPDGFRSLASQLPVEDADGNNTEQVSSLSDTDHVIQLILLLSAQVIHAFHSVSFSGPLPVASIPADSEINMGSPF